MVERLTGRRLEDVLADPRRLSDLETGNKPVVFTEAISHWPACQKWCGVEGREHLKSLAGDAPIDVMCSRDDVFFGAVGQHTMMHCTLGEFLDEERQTGWRDIQLNTYLAQARIDHGPLRPLAGDIVVEEHPYPSDLQLNLWMSSQSKSRSSPHYDPYENLLCLIGGFKRVKVYPVGMTDCFYPYPVWSEAHNHSTVNFADPDLANHPKYRTAVEAELVVELKPGDALFIPEGWWHQVDSHENTIAVNIWWQSETSRRVIQGGKSAFYLRQLLKTAANERVQELVSSIQPLQLDMCRQQMPVEQHGERSSTTSASHHTDLIHTLISILGSCEESQAKGRKGDFESIESPSLFSPLSAEEQSGLEALKLLLMKEDESSSSTDSAADVACVDGGITRWLRTFPSLRMQLFWETELTPINCYLLTDHFEVISAEDRNSESEQFYEIIFGAAAGRQEVLERMHKGSEALLEWSFRATVVQLRG